MTAHTSQSAVPEMLYIWSHDVLTFRRQIRRHPPQTVESSFPKAETIQLGPVRRGHGPFLSPEIYGDEVVHSGCPWQCPKTETSPVKGLWMYNNAPYTYAVFVRILIFSARSILFDRLSPAEFSTYALLFTVKWKIILGNISANFISIFHPPPHPQ